MIRDLQSNDKNVFISMVNEFYSSNAVVHSVDPKNFEITFQQAVIDKSPFLRALIIEDDNEKPLGYALLSFTYSNEAGGLVVLIEELYLNEACRGKGIGRQFFEYLEQEYPSAKRFRLEATKENEDAIRLYQRLDYKVLDYIQLIKDTD
ncbi:GNAT family N-acetyltransferase [Clostridium merdae]|uniref:GNAT family N-acetyltransferase n=1 Tax=Clostridium merdae TaxID=1958780 RepID=UPI000A26E5D8|nr:GNAT family N-acetyltransferase [Clostridium merdae]